MKRTYQEYCDELLERFNGYYPPPTDLEFPKDMKAAEDLLIEMQNNMTVPHSPSEYRKKFSDKINSLNIDGIMNEIDSLYANYKKEKKFPAKLFGFASMCQLMR